MKIVYSRDSRRFPKSNPLCHLRWKNKLNKFETYGTHSLHSNLAFSLLQSRIARLILGWMQGVETQNCTFPTKWFHKGFRYVFQTILQHWISSKFSKVCQHVLQERVQQCASLIQSKQNLLNGIKNLDGIVLSRSLFTHCSLNSSRVSSKTESNSQTLLEAVWSST